MASHSNVRVPLQDAFSRANSSTAASSPRHHKHKPTSSHSSAPFPPHHDSLMPGPSLNNRNLEMIASQTRQSAQQQDYKRASQISSTSTNAEAQGRRRKTHIGPWELGADVGKGGCGKVRKVRHRITGQQAAAKIISKRIAETARAESLASLVESSRRPNAGALALGANIIPFGIEREVVIMKLLKHPNVVQLFDVWENRNELYLIMEYVNGGELFEFVEDREFLEEDETVYLFRQIVAALLHCHRLGIHHRDLKPENILLEQNTLQVKLVDFGMAALQPRGKLLTTPCGSIHYAAPEVFEKSYDGSKVDVWSLGIILYVMLTGATPFLYEASTMAKDVGKWYDVIKRGKFDIPEALSLEAHDLLRKMLIPNPKRRISLEDVWNHPFVHKYEKEWGESPEESDIEKWVGTAPVIDSWDIRKSTDIDREILRNLRTLWHSEKEEAIVQKLLSKEPNQEKYFYSALQKHREEQLESYLAGTEDVSYSTSDRHHAKPESRSQNVLSLPKTTSQFSILNNEHLSRNILPERTPSSASYDPYRASRGGSIAKDKNYLSVTVHGRASRQSLSKSIHSNSRRPLSRVEALRQGSRRASTVSSSISLRPPSVSVSQAGSRRSMSRQSLAQSVSRNSLARSMVVKPHLHKRGVEFNHLRRSSTSSAITPRPLSQARSQSPRKYPTKYDSSPNMQAPSSPPAGGVVIRSRKEGRRALQNRNKLSNNRTYSQVIAHDARQVSTELEKFCEQVFFRDSTDTSDRTSSTSHAPYDTPPSSLSNRGSYNAPNVGKVMMTPLAQDAKRPPAETPNTFIARELLETKRRLADRYAKDENAQGVAYHEVMAHLDALLQPGNSFAPETGREYSPYLPVISEEGRSDADEARTSRDTNARQPVTRQSSSDNPNTIRMVLPSSPPQIKPLVIRKNSSESSGSRRSGNSDEIGPSFSRTSVPGSHVVRKPTPTTALVLGTIAEEAVSSPTKSDHEESTTKKDNWFTRRFRSRDVSGASQRSWDDLDDRQGGKQGSVFSRSKLSPGPGPGPLSPASKDSSQNIPKVLRGKRPGFLKIFTRKRKQPEQLTSDRDGQNSSTSTLTVSASTNNNAWRGRRNHTLDPTEITHPGDLGVSQSWLARILHIKPVTRILCFTIGRGRARQEVVRLLRKWKPDGIRDVVLDRPRNLVFGRLDSKNGLDIREVSFVIELYVMLAGGRKANLSVCRITQRKGAASSFKMVAEAIEHEMSKKDFLVKDEEMKREMESVLASV